MRETGAAEADALSPAPTASNASVDPSTRFSHAERRNIILGLMLAILLGGLDQTIVAVALPRMGDRTRTASR